MMRTVGLLLWLRYRTMFRGGSGGRQIFAMILGLLVLTPLALMIGVLSWKVTRDVAGDMGPEALLLWVRVAFFLFFAMLLAMPILSFASTDFYDITKLFHLPVPHRPVFVAQIVGMMFGGSTLFFLPAMVGVVFGAGGAARMVVSVPLLLLFLFQTVAVARLLQLLLLNTLRSRRFRDLAAIGAAGLSAGLFVVFRLTFKNGDPTQTVSALIEGLVESSAADWIVAVPSSWFSTLMVPGAGVGSVLLMVLVALPLTVLTVRIAAVLQERAFHGEVPVAQPRIRAKNDTKTDLRPGLFRFLPESVRAVARKEISLIRREPIVKTMMIQQSVFFLVPVVFAIFGGGGAAFPGLKTLLIWGLSLLLFVESILAMNFFGLEGPGIVVTLLSPTPRHRVLLGKSLAYFLLFAPVNVLFVVAATVLVHFLSGSASLVLFGTGLVGAISATLVLLGAGSIVSVLAPVRMASGARGALRQPSTGEGCLLALFKLLAIGVLFVLALPIVGLGWFPMLSPLALVYGALVLLTGTMLGAHLFTGREEKMMLTLARSAE